MALTWRGHTAHLEVRERPGEEQTKWWAVCSCGFRSTWRATDNDATGALLNHLWRSTVSPEYPVKGWMERRRGVETMTRKQFMQAIQGPSTTSG